MPLRSFGSVSKAELLKEQWVPATCPLNGSTWNSGGILLDGVNEDCYCTLKVPPNYTSLQALCIRVILINAGTNTYNVGADTVAANSGQHFNTRATVNALTVAGDQLHVAEIDLSTILGMMIANDSLEIRVYYAAAGGGGIASNMVVLGAYLRWL